MFPIIVNIPLVPSIIEDSINVNIVYILSYPDAEYSIIAHYSTEPH